MIKLDLRLAALIVSRYKHTYAFHDPILKFKELKKHFGLRFNFCSGALILARLGLLGAVPACTDLTTKPWVQAAGVEVLNQPFFASGNVATAGGCFASPYLAAWIIARTEGQAAAESALHYVAPVGEKDEYVARAMKNITPYLAR